MDTAFAYTNVCRITFIIALNCLIRFLKKRKSSITKSHLFDLNLRTSNYVINYISTSLVCKTSFTDMPCDVHGLSLTVIYVSEIMPYFTMCLCFDKKLWTSSSTKDTTCPFCLKRLLTLLCPTLGQLIAWLSFTQNANS